MSIKVNGINLAGTAEPEYYPDLLDCKWSDHLLNNISWLRSDTFSWQSGLIYTAAYQHLLSDWTNENSITRTESVGGIVITYKLSPDGHKLVSSDYELAVQNIFINTGIAWYYIIDITNSRFKLPRTTFAFTGIRDQVGNYIAPGLPNITGSWTSQYNISMDNNSNCIGAIASTYNTGTGYYGSNTASADWGYGFNFDASKSNSIYGASTTVQTPATEMYLYFYVGKFAQVSETNTARILEEVNTKQDKSTALNKNYITNCISKIPQDIKLELNNGIATLKAGSKVYIPNGFEQDGTTPHYDIITISNDKSVNSYGYDVTCLLFYDYTNDLLKICYKGQCSCGSSYSTTGGSLFYWYDVNTNLVRRSTDGSVWEDNLISLPLAECQSSTTKITSINHVFNGFGYIGASIFVLPGLTYLIPDGKNDDGSLKNYEYVQNKIYWITDSGNSYKIASGQRMFGILLLQNGEIWKGQWNLMKTMLAGRDCDKPTTLSVTNTHYYYATDTNILYITQNGTTTAEWEKVYTITLGEYTKDTDALTYLSTFSPKVAYALNNDEHAVISFMKPTSTNNYTWFRLYADGWVEQGGKIITGEAPTTTTHTMNLPIVMADTNYNLTVEGITGDTSSNTISVQYGHYFYGAVWNSGKTTTSFNYRAPVGGCWEVKGMSAYSV